KTTSGSLDLIESTSFHEEIRRQKISYPQGTDVLNALLGGGNVLSATGNDAIASPLSSRYPMTANEGFTIERASLRGSSQIFGMVELACHRSVGEEAREAVGLSGGDCLWLAASYLANAITTFRSRNETIVLAALSRFLSDPDVEGSFENVNDVFANGLEIIIT